ncbi:UNVERIFIED_CONTAM: hypothetical protein FKN15_064348 [Acipenser sinensis]
MCRQVDTFLTKDCNASTCSMRNNNYQLYAAKYQHMLCSQLSPVLQTPTQKNMELAMQFAEEGRLCSEGEAVVLYHTVKKFQSLPQGGAKAFRSRFRGGMSRLAI